MSADIEDKYIGVGHTLLRLTKGLIHMRVVAPDDNPTPTEAFEDLREQLERFSSVEDIGMLMVKLLRLGVAFNVRPTSDTIAEGTVVANIESGLELLASMKGTPADETFRCIGIAISCLTDYGQATASPFLDDISNEEKEEYVRSGLVVAEASARSMPSEDRLRAGCSIFDSIHKLMMEAKPEEEEDK